MKAGKSPVADGRKADSPDAAPGSAQGGALYDPAITELARLDAEVARLRHLLAEARAKVSEGDVETERLRSAIKHLRNKIDGYDETFEFALAGTGLEP